jgi:tetratricopeptide (TPR) repeat protein
MKISGKTLIIKIALLMITAIFNLAGYSSAQQLSVKKIISELEKDKNLVTNIVLQESIERFFDKSSDSKSRARILDALEMHAHWHRPHGGDFNLRSVKIARSFLKKHGDNKNDRGRWDFAGEIREIANQNGKAKQRAKELNVDSRKRKLTVVEALELQDLKNKVEANDKLIAGYQKSAALSAWKPRSAKNISKAQKEFTKKFRETIKSYSELADKIRSDDPSQIGDALGDFVKNEKEYFQAAEKVFNAYQDNALRNVGGFKGKEHWIDLDGDGVEQKILVYSYDNLEDDFLVATIGTTNEAAEKNPGLKGFYDVSRKAWAQVSIHYPDLLVTMTENTKTKSKAIDSLIRKGKQAEALGNWKDARAYYEKAEELDNSLPLGAKLFKRLRGKKDPGKKAKYLRKLSTHSSSNSPNNSVVKASYKPMTRKDARKIVRSYGSIPGGVTLEGDGKGIRNITSASYSKSEGSIILNGRIKYEIPVTPDEMKAILMAISEDDKIGVSLVSGYTTYGALAKDSEILLMLRQTDWFLAHLVYGWKNNYADYKTANGVKLRKRDDELGNIMCYFRFTDFQFKLHESRYELKSSGFVTTLIPIKVGERAGDGGGLPDFEAIDTQNYPKNLLHNIRHIADNADYYMRERMMRMANCYGEAAAFARGLKGNGIDLRMLANTISSDSLQKNKIVLLSDNVTKQDLVGTWLVERQRKDEYKAIYRLYSDGTASTMPGRKRGYFTWELQNKIFRMFYGKEKKNTLSGKIVSNRELVSAANSGGNRFWKTWMATKISKDTEQPSDLFEVCNKKKSIEWSCINKGKGERGCYGTVPWEKTTSFEMGTCREQCRRLAAKRNKMGYKSSCAYDLSQKDMVGTWLMQRTGRDGYKSIYRFHPDGRVSTRPNGYRGSFKWEYENKTFRMFYGKENKLSIRGKLVSETEMVPAEGTVKTKFWTKWKAEKKSTDTKFTFDLFQVCKKRDTIQWSCYNRGRGEKGCNATVPWEQTTAFDLNTCKEQCSKLAVKRNKMGYKSTCLYDSR